MPTGYTYAIKDGISFEKFAMDCARAFGACVLLRDEGGGGEVIPDAFEPSQHHFNAAMSARKELAALDEISDEEAERKASEEFDKAETSSFVRLQEHRDLRAKYEAMLEKVRAWKPPTPDHEEMKKFMADQITSSIRFDCDEKYYSTPTVRVSGAEWLAAAKKRAKQDIQYHEAEYEREVDRAKSRTAWIQALRNSLK